MGTHGLIIVKEDDQEIVRIFSHFDGQPEALGNDLSSFFEGKKVVCGIDDYSSENFNGMGCLAASLIKHLKEGIGNIYIRPDIESSDVNYTYEITTIKEGEVNIKIRG